MGFAGSIIFLAAFVALAFSFWRRLPDLAGLKLRRWFLVWLCKGIIVPFFIWMLFNSGVSYHLPTLVPQLESPGSGGPSLQVFINVSAIGFFYIVSYWAAMTSIWLLAAAASRAEHRDEVKQHVIVWTALLGPVAALIIYAAGWRLVGVATTVWIFPMAQMIFTLTIPNKTAPHYSRAVALMNFGKFKSAESAVLHELEICEDDFNGWMMLADLYANHFGDLVGAERLIHETCDQPMTTVPQVGVAFHRLADWHLHLANDPLAARRSLEEICRRFPETHLDRMARLRINQLPRSKEELLEGRKARRIRMPALISALGESTAPTPEITPADAIARANQLSAKLTANPDDISSREELARVLADELGKADLAIEQIELLLELPAHPPRKTAEWLAMLAAWHFTHRQDHATARKIMERLIHDLPDSPQAFAAHRRLALMDAEARMRAARTGAKVPRWANL